MQYRGEEELQVLPRVREGVNGSASVCVDVGEPYPMPARISCVLTRGSAPARSAIRVGCSSGRRPDEHPTFRDAK
jgi:hypothetical protein